MPCRIYYMKKIVCAAIVYLYSDKFRHKKLKELVSEKGKKNRQIDRQQEKEKGGERKGEGGRDKKREKNLSEIERDGEIERNSFSLLLYRGKRDFSTGFSKKYRGLHHGHPQTTRRYCSSLSDEPPHAATTATAGCVVDKENPTFLYYLIMGVCFNLLYHHPLHCKTEHY